MTKLLCVFLLCLSPVSVKLASLSGKSVYFFGDSISAGTGATSSAYGWCALFSANKGASEQNLAVGGTSVTPGIGTVTFDSTLVPTFNASTMGALFMAYGVNDVANGATAVNFQTALSTAIDAILKRGWPANDIIICSMFYVSTDVQTTCQQFVDAAQTVATNKGVYYVDFYTAIKNDPSVGTYYGTDKTHPNNAGHAAYAAVAINATTNFLKNASFLRKGKRAILN